MTQLFGTAGSQIDPWTTYVFFCRYANMIRNSLAQNQGFLASTSSRKISEVLCDFPQISQANYTKILHDEMPELIEKKLSDFEIQIRSRLRFLLEPQPNLNHIDANFVTTFHQVMKKLMMSSKFIQLLFDFDPSYCQDVQLMISQTFNSSSFSLMLYQTSHQKLKDPNYALEKPYEEDKKGTSNKRVPYNQSNQFTDSDQSQKFTKQATQTSGLSRAQTEQKTSNSANKIKPSSTGNKLPPSNNMGSHTTALPQNLSKKKGQNTKAINQGAIKSHNIPATSQTSSTFAKQTQDQMKNLTKQQQNQSQKPKSKTSAKPPQKSQANRTAQNQLLLAHTTQALVQNSRQFSDQRLTHGTQALTRDQQRDPSSTGDIRTANYESVKQEAKRNTSGLPDINKSSSSGSDHLYEKKNYEGNKETQKPRESDYDDEDII
eukprot:403374784